MSTWPITDTVVHKQHFTRKSTLLTCQESECRIWMRHFGNVLGPSLNSLRSHVIPVDHRPFSQKFYELLIQILKQKHSCWSYLKTNNPIMSQICTCQDSSAVVTFAKLWPDWIVGIILTAWRIFIRFQLWAHKPFAKIKFILLRLSCQKKKNSTLFPRDMVIQTSTCCYMKHFRCYTIFWISILVSLRCMRRMWYNRLLYLLFLVLL